MLQSLYVWLLLLRVSVVPHFNHIAEQLIFQFGKLAWFASESELFAACIPQCTLLVAPSSNTLLIHVEFSARRTLAMFKSKLRDFQFKASCVDVEVLAHHAKIATLNSSS